MNQFVNEEVVTIRTRHGDEDLLDSGGRKGKQWVIKWNPERVSQPDRQC